MTTNRLPILATAFGGCMLGMLSLLLCIAFWGATGDPSWNLFLPYLLPDFPAITLIGVIRGLIIIGLLGAYAGSVFAAFFNLWTRLAAALFGRG